MTHICVSKLTIIGSDNGLLPDQRLAIIWTNAGILLIGPLGTNFSEISIEILTFSIKKIRLKVPSAKRRPFCLGLNVLTNADQPSVKSCSIRLRAILQQMLKMSILNMNLKITDFRLQPHIPDVNELISSSYHKFHFAKDYSLMIQTWCKFCSPLLKAVRNDCCLILHMSQQLGCCDVYKTWSTVKSLI